MIIRKLPQFLMLIFALQISCLNAQTDLKWINVLNLSIGGQAFAESTEHPFDRLPKEAKKTVRPPVWKLSQNTAGIYVEFETDATQIACRWYSRFEGHLNHMPDTGVKGVDLYIKQGDNWKWAGVGRPDSVLNYEMLINEMLPGKKQCRVYFPLYDGLIGAFIGVPDSAMIQPTPKEQSNLLPIVFYGTSITQGGCASRPGMSYPAIIGRQLQREVYNLGFSGNGRLEQRLADLLGTLDVALYVIDCLPNLTAEQVAERTEPFVLKLRELRPNTPILLVENIEYQQAWLNQERRRATDGKNAALKEAFERLKKEGVEDIFYQTSADLLGSDGEGTVDGVHLTDLGFLRFSNAILPQIQKKLQQYE